MNEYVFLFHLVCIGKYLPNNIECLPLALGISIYFI